MNWKVLFLLSGLTLIAPLPAYSSTNLHSQTEENSVIVAQSDAMNQGDAMRQESTMNQGGAMNQSSAILRTGSTGEQVRSVQKFLRRKGFYNGSINGVFDQETRAAVINFQNSRKISPTGIVGPTTRNAMI
ncbi:Peptidoglycan-binding domain 1 protein [Crinalium epipsammum PCC 9333]|uniref:Peptidoglycan-binding domain 1 protein n=1 Tax=Crinalium epipsammum PCC 9333 TaxID=1173022 RepID=K9W1Y5_9CYAN|nr:peptidoglycan-binding domain-containing protein [Crinalium epipsammum]AFZ14373.1 Peptidoglycan-binding domain 1 protein [Crinalium epipsammum PCC 9333]